MRSLYADAYKPANAAPRRRPPPLRDHFEPLGIRAGAFVLKPSVEITRGIDSNPARTTRPEASFFTVVEPALQARSNWLRHEFGADLRGSYSFYDDASSLNRPSVDGKAYIRLDVSSDTIVNLEGRTLLSTDNPGSPNLLAGIAKLTIFTTHGATVGVTQRFNRLEISTKASVDRTEYQDSKLTDGSTSSNHDRDLDQYGGQLRMSYEIMPGIKPFAEIGGDTRQHDQQFDRNGLRRDSRAFSPKVGTTFELTPLLTGEVSVGHLTRKYDDPALQNLRGVVFDSALVYTASALTSVTLGAKSRADEIIVGGTSGVLRRDVTLQVDHSFRRWLLGTLKLGYGTDDYIGSTRADDRISLGSAMAYKFNREFWIKGEYRYERRRSNAADSDYDASAFLLGVRLQR